MSPISLWLADYQLLAAALLLGVMLAIAALRQPAQRQAVAKSTLAALAALAILCALPGWSLVHLLSEQPVAHEAITTPTSESTSLAPPAAKFTPSLEAENVAIVQPTSSSAASPQLTSPPAAPINWIALSVAAYAAGSAAVTLWLITGALLAHRVRRQATPAPPELQALLQQLCGAEKRAPQLLISPRITAPVALGLRRPTILLPPSALPLPPSQLLPILAHELAHLQHRDLHTLAATRLLFILLWPQPLYWLLRRTIRLDQETLADAAAADRAGRLDYAQQLLAWASSASTQRPPRLAGAVGLWEGPSQLKRRIAVLLNEQFNVMRSCSRRWKALSVGCIISLATMLSLVTLQPALSAPENEDQTTSVQSAKPAETEVDSTPAKERESRMQTLVGQLTRTPNVFMGYCIDEAGQPLANVDVSLFVYDSSAKQNVEPIARVQTDADGRFEFKQPVDVAKEFPNGVPEDNFVKPPVKVIAAVAKSPGLTTEFQNDALYMFVKRGQAAIMQMKPAQKLTGRVLDDKGQPVADALVTTTKSTGGYIPGDNLRARTDAEGRYEIDDVPSFDAEKEAQAHAAARERGEMRGLYPVPSVLLTVDHPGFATRRMNVKKIPSELDVALSPSATVKGRVVAQSADANEPPRPLSNVPVLITRTRQPSVSADPIFVYVEQQRGVTDADGNYSFTSLPASEYAVTATAPNLTTIGVRGIEATAGQTATAPDVVLTPGGIVRVKLVDGKTNEPLKFKAGQKGYINPRRNPSAFYEPTPGAVEPPSMDSPIVAFTADAIGEIRLPPGRYDLSVSIPVEGAYLADVTSKARPVDDEFEVREGETIERTIPLLEVQPASLGITGVAQPIGQPTEGDDSAKKKDRSASGAALQFTPAFTPADSNDEGSAPSSSRIIEIDGKQVILGDPIPESELQDRGSQPTFDRSGGRLQVAPPKTLYPAVAPMPAPVTAQAWRQASGQGIYAVVPLVAQKPSTENANKLEISVVDEQDAPLAGVEASIYRVSRQKFDHRLDRTVTTDADGKFVVDKLVSPNEVEYFKNLEVQDAFHQGAPEGGFVIALQRPGLATAQVFQSAGPLALYGATRSIKMRPAVKLSGRVTDPEGKPLPGAKVVAGDFLIAIEGIDAVETDAEGRYEFDDRAAFDRAESKNPEVRVATLLNMYVDPQAATNVSPEDPSARLVSNLVASHPDYAVTRVEGGNVPGVTDIQLNPVAPITGRVVRHGSGEPAADVTVQVEGWTDVKTSVRDGTQSRVGYWDTSKTDANGFYHFPNLPPGLYSVWADSGIHLSQTPWVSQEHNDIKAVAGGEPTVAPDLVIGPPGVIRVQLIDGESGQPIELPSDAVVHPSPLPLLGEGIGHRPFHTQNLSATAEGRFETKMVPGKFRMLVFVSKNFTEPQTIWQTGDDVDSTGEVFDLQPGETISATIKVLSIARINALRERSEAALKRVEAARKLLEEQKDDEAMAAYSEVIADFPEYVLARHNRANLHNFRGDYEAELADNEAILKMEPSNAAAMYGVAKLLATISNDELRNGERALDLAGQLLKHAERSGDQNWQSVVLDIQAAAYAELGKFDLAVATQQAAMELGSEGRDPGMRERLEQYKLNKPSRTPRQAKPFTDAPAKQRANQGASKTSDPRTPFWTVPASTDVKLTVAVVPPAKADGILIDSRAPENETWRLLPESALKVGNPATLQEAVQ